MRPGRARADHIVSRAGPPVAIAGIERRSSTLEVYNFEVEGFHSYFVGHTSGGVRVHNISQGYTLGGLMQGSPYYPTQLGVSADKVNAMAEAMQNGTFDWAKSAESPILIDSFGNITHGHHRVVAAQAAGVSIPASSIGSGSTYMGPRISWGSVYAY